MTKKPPKNIFSRGRIFFYILSIAIFYLAFRYFGNLEKIGNLFLEMNPSWIILAFGAQTATYFLYAMVLRILLNNAADNVKTSTLFKFSLVSIFLNQAIPSGGLSGSGYIFEQLRIRRVDSNVTFSVLIIECICYYIAFILLLSIFSLWQLNISGLNHLQSYTVMLGIIFYVIMTLLLLLLTSKGTLKRTKILLKRIPWAARYLDKLNLQMGKGGRGYGIINVFFKQGKSSILATFFQAMVISCDVLTVFAILKGFGISLPLYKLYLAVMLSMVIGALPISPGGLLTYESAMTYFLTATGLVLHVALTVTIIFRFLSFWLPMPIGILLYRHLKRKLHQKNLQISTR